MHESATSRKPPQTMRTEKETKRVQKTNKEDTHDEKETLDAGTGILPGDSNATGGGYSTLSEHGLI